VQTFNLRPDLRTEFTDLSGKKREVDVVVLGERDVYIGEHKAHVKGPG